MKKNQSNYVSVSEMIKLVTQVWEYRYVYVREVAGGFRGLTQNLCLFLMEQRNLKFFSQISYKTLLMFLTQALSLEKSFPSTLSETCGHCARFLPLLPLPGQCEFPRQDFVPMICGSPELQRSLYLLVYSMHSFMLFERMDGEEAREHMERTGGEQNHGS